MFLKKIISKDSFVYSALKNAWHLAIFAASVPVKSVLILWSRTAFKKLLNSCTQYDLHFMHRCGGGTEVYVQNTLRSKTDYILLRNLKIFRFQELYTLELYNIKSPIFILARDIKKLDGIARSVYIENLYSYKNIPYILKLIAGFSKKIVFKLHDFYSTCYRVTMIKDNHYCGCTCDASCSLPVDGFLWTPGKWRGMWKEFFDRVDEFLFFSDSSMKIFTSIYDISQEKTAVIPHDMSYASALKIKSLPEEFNIGVFGNVTYDAKGYSVLKSFAEFSKGKDYKIYMNGHVSESESDVFSNNENFIQCGSYTTEEIYSRLISQKIGVVFFTSICPETFSYVVSELILTGIPVACFDIGAQAEKIRNYPLGFIIQDFKNESIEKALRECHQKGFEYYKVLNVPRRGGVRTKSLPLSAYRLCA